MLVMKLEGYRVYRIPPKMAGKAMSKHEIFGYLFLQTHMEIDGWFRFLATFTL